MSSGSSVRLVFDDVCRCVDIESFNRFVSQFLDEHGLVDEARRRMYWALFYRWKEALSSHN